MIQDSRIFITGTSTDVGKTVASAILVKALGADYWKPVQCGDLENSDTNTLRNLVGADHLGTFHPERYRLKLPQSVHIAAAAEQKLVRLSDFAMPQTSRTLVIEGAGGALVPLNDDETVIDIARHLDVGVVLLTKFYLGTYNHTLLTIEALQARGIRILGIILNGQDAPEFCEFITRKTGVRFLGIIPTCTKVDSETIATLAHEWRGKFS